MNILPKKSWHVLSRDNLERVRKDEAEAKRQEDEKAKRATLAEQEARVQFMRQRARTEQIKGQYEDLIKGPTSTATSTNNDQRESTVVGGAMGGVDTESRHINFFADMKTTGVGLEGSINVEHEKEKKQEQEAWEKKTGILTYLVDKESGASSEPWYAKRKDRKENKRSHDDKKALMDPLNEMKGYVDAKRKHLELNETSSTHSPSLSSKTSSLKMTKESSSSTHHRHRSKKKKKDKEEDKRLMMEKLRAERRRREESERARSELVMKKHYGLLTEEKQDETTTSGKYNNQFNPHLSRTK